MKRLTLCCTLVASGFLMSQAFAQENQRPNRGADGDRNAPPNPVLKALDPDGNRELSGQEIDGAPAALLKLDTNEDGKLTRDELRPSGAGGGGGQRPAAAPGGRPDAPFRFNPFLASLDANRDGDLDEDEIKGTSAALRKLDQDKDGKVTGAELRPQRGAGGVQGGGPGSDPGDFSARIMSQDKNGDGKVTREEMPERMQRILERADANSDGAVDKAEADAFAKEFSNRRPGGQGGQGGQGGGNRNNP